MNGTCFSVFRRNFGSYFSGPLGWLFICVFVSLSVLSAFWPHEFFNNNLANLDSLNRLFPMVMLVFVPAITMGLWADERRQGTDELLLTLPATDFQIVLGKYFSALGIYTASLVFSGICTYSVLRSLGNPDGGLFVVTYLGYWFIGWAMLAVGMVASFLTSSLPVAYILGAVFNAPFVFATNADVICGNATIFGCDVNLADVIRRWSFAEQFRDFARGVFSVSGVVFFAMIVVVMLYICMVLIGRRHWNAGGRGTGMALHYAVRASALVAVLVSVNFVFANHDLRLDGSAEKLSTLSPATIRLLDQLRTGTTDDAAGDTKNGKDDGKKNDATAMVDGEMRSVQIEAFVSPEVPKNYVETRLNLIAMLREISARSGGKVRVRIHDTQPFSEEAERAEKAYGITSRTIGVQQRGQFDQQDVFMGIVFQSGMEKVTLPFISRGIPVEYELVRSLMTVTSQRRRVLGVLETDAGLFQKFNPATGAMASEAAIILELKKTYDVRQIDPSKPITDEVDALMAIQPSSLSPEAWKNFMDYVKTGNSVIVFEDPFPVFATSVPGTSQVKTTQASGMYAMMMPPQPVPKGDDRELWDLLGVSFSRDRIVFQNYNPEVRFRGFPKEFVWVDSALRYDGKSVFSQDDPSVIGLQKVLFPHPGYITPLQHLSKDASQNTKLTFRPLVRTGAETGYTPYREILNTNDFGEKTLNPDPRRTVTQESYILAAKIDGTVELPPEPPTGPSAADAQLANAGASGTDPTKSTEEEDADGKSVSDASLPGPRTVRVNVLLVADLDCTTNQFFMIREQGDNEDFGIRFDFDNVTMVLNLIDQSIGDERFCEIRSRRRIHRTLSKIDALTKDAETAATQQIEDLREESRKVQSEIEAEAQKKQAEVEANLRKQYEKDGKISDAQMLGVIQELARIKQQQSLRNKQKIQQIARELEDKVKEIDRKLVREEQRIQDRYKLWSVLLPPIPPLIVALAVWGVRRAREREGMSPKRQRQRTSIASR